VYVLVDAHTGSAAESFAYTMQHAGRAKIVGEHSGGAANPGRFFEAGHGFRVFVPTGSPVNPISGGNWEGTGVIPDVTAPSDAALEKAIALATKAARR
jgi:C-terminal processing protease CtpA/Prc